MKHQVVFFIFQKPAHVRSSEGLAIYRPKTVAFQGLNLQVFSNSFGDGVDQHEKAATFWDAHIDQSK